MAIQNVFILQFFVQNNRHEISQISSSDSTDKTKTVGSRTLVIHNAQLSDSGNYMCKVIDHNEISNEKIYPLTVLQQDEGILELTTDQSDEVTVSAKKAAKLVFSYDSHPPATFAM